MYVRPTIYVTQPEKREALFILGISLCAPVGKVHEATSYLVGGCALNITDVDIREALCGLSKRFCDARPTSSLTGNALVVIAAQVSGSTLLGIRLIRQCWTSLDDTMYLTTAYEATVSSGNFELSSCKPIRRTSLTSKDVQVLDLAAVAFSCRPISSRLERRAERYRVARPYMLSPFKVMISVGMSR